MVLAMSQLIPDFEDCSPPPEPGAGWDDIMSANWRSMLAICCGSPNGKPPGVPESPPPGPPLPAPEPESPERRPDSSSGSFGMLKPKGRSLTIRPQAGIGLISTVTLTGSCPE